MRRWVVVLPAATAFAAGLLGVSAHLSFEAELEADVTFSTPAHATPLPHRDRFPHPYRSHPDREAELAERAARAATAPDDGADATPQTPEDGGEPAVAGETPVEPVAGSLAPADPADQAPAEAKAPDAVLPEAADPAPAQAAAAQPEDAPEDAPASASAETPAAEDPPREIVDGEDAGEIAPAVVEDETGVRRKLVEIGRGDTLLGVLVSAAVPREEAMQAIDALRRVFNPRTLRIGQEVAVMFDRADGQDRFMGLTITPNVQRSVTVSRGQNDAYEAKAIDRPLELRVVAAEGRISASLFEAGVSAGLPISVLSDVIKLFSYDVDFQRDIQRDDAFRILFERHFTDEGMAAREGDILMAELLLSGKAMTFYRFKTRDGLVDYFNRKGESIRKALLRTPVDGARLTSGFGLRRHPILGYSKLHAGVDFGVPTGTPIYAAGGGSVDEIGGKGAYGNYVRIRHNKEIATAYAHMSRFAAGLKRGDRVRQGEVIGYVGSTGRSTGPHLHYEVLKNGRQVNPLSVDLPTGQVLEGKELAAFRKVVDALERQFAETRTPPLVAETVGLRPPGPKPQPSASEKACTDAPC